MVKILLLMTYLMTTGDFLHATSEWKGPDITSCRTYAKAYNLKSLPDGVRDMRFQCVAVEINPLRGSRRA